MDLYEKKYKDAIEMARDAFYSPETPHVAKAWLLTMFPTIAESESAESDDERIRKVLFDYFQAYKDKEDYGITTFNGIPTDNILAWLENQGKKQSMWTDNDRVMAFTLMRDVDQMTYISNEGKNERIEWLNSLEDKFNNEE